MKKTIRRLTSENNFDYGRIGESTGYKNLKVGDIVSHTTEHGMRLNTFVAKRDNGKYGVMGLLSRPFESINELTLVLSHEDVKDSAYKNLCGGMFFVETIKVKTLTIEQIEAKLGYPIEIVQ